MKKFFVFLLLIPLSIMLLVGCSSLLPKGDKGDIGIPGVPGVTGEAGVPGVTGEAGVPGVTGEAGVPGATGEAGATLIKSYVGTFPSTGNFTLDVPEITGNLGSTFVMAYWAFSTSPDIWTPMADGWIDNVDLAHIFAVSWTFGKVYFTGVTAGELYLVQVYQNN